MVVSDKDRKTGDWMSTNQDEQAPASGGIKPSIWKPRAASFRKYNSMQAEKRARPQRGLRGVVSPPVVVKLTRLIVGTYQKCNPSFTYSDSFNPKRYLTNPSAGVSNNNLDNKNSDLILAVNDVLLNVQSNHRYVVKEMLGQGTFGQVVKCWSENDSGHVAVKVIKNQPAYFQQARVEIEILRMLNQQFDPDDTHHIVRLLDYFVFESHLCIAFELLSHNLFELIKVNRYRGISLQLLRSFTKQILDSLVLLRDAGVIHCDLKPENILLSTSLKKGEIKLIDFGSACLENRTVYSYIQSRFYRSPEVVLGHRYTAAIDMWSLGCVAAELFLGLPLFAGESEYDLLRRMIETLGCQPPDWLLRNSKNTSKYFKNVSAAPPSEAGTGSYQFLTASEFKQRENKDPVVGKSYLKHTKLEEIIAQYPYKKDLGLDEIETERKRRLVFLDFLRGLVRFDPATRWTPLQASRHPFITEEPFTGRFEPLPETPRTPVGHGHVMTVEHNPGAGHWFGAGLSPQISHVSVGPYGSPQYQGGPFSFASSYGSCGSFGSCDGYLVGGSYDMTNIYFPTPPGGPPIDWRRMYPTMAPGYGPLGISPSNSVFQPVSLGGSPSQFTPPGSQFPSPSSSQSSPGRYGPPSPARYGKVAAMSHHYKWRTPVNQNTGFSVPRDGIRQHQQPNGAFDGSNHLEAGASGSSHSRPHGQSHLRPSRGSSVKSTNFRAGSLEAYLSTSETIPEAVEPSAAHPDWFPDDSDCLLEEENHRHQQHLASGSGGARLGPGQGGGFNPRGAGTGYKEHSGFLNTSRFNDSQHFSHAGSASTTLYGSYDERQPGMSYPRLTTYQIPFSSPQHTSIVFSRQINIQHYRQQAPHSIYQPGQPHSLIGFPAGYQCPYSTTPEQHLAEVAR